jgi:hypothetical protein
VAAEVAFADHAQRAVPERLVTRGDSPPTARYHAAETGQTLPVAALEVPRPGLGLAGRVRLKHYQGDDGPGRVGTRRAQIFDVALITLRPWRPWCEASAP